MPIIAFYVIVLTTCAYMLPLVFEFIDKSFSCSQEAINSSMPLLVILVIGFGFIFAGLVKIKQNAEKEQ